MKSVTLAEARQSFSALIAEVETFDEHVMITKNGRPTAVIISADEWEAIEDTAFWRSVPDIASDIAESRREEGVSLAEFLATRQTNAE
jgi:antitoxin YefM